MFANCAFLVVNISPENWKSDGGAGANAKDKQYSKLICFFNEIARSLPKTSRFIFKSTFLKPSLLFTFFFKQSDAKFSILFLFSGSENLFGSETHASMKQTFCLYPIDFTYRRKSVTSTEAAFPVDTLNNSISSIQIFFNSHNKSFK